MKLGQFNEPEGTFKPVCEPGAFQVGVIGLDHGHIYGMCSALQDAGASIVSVYDPDVKKVEHFRSRFPQARAEEGEEAILENRIIALVASAAIPCDRGPLGLRVLASDKDYFSDKPPFTTQEQVDQARAAVRKTGRKWFVYYSERIHVESAVKAGYLLDEGTIGDVVSIHLWAPHRLAAPTRPDWFFRKASYGGILTDIGSHQIEQVLFYSKAKDARIVSSRVGNLHHGEYPELEDFGDACLDTDTHIPCYINVDWYTPDGLGTWGDGRLVIVGTKGYMELRKYLNVATERTTDHIFLVDGKEERHLQVAGTVGFPFFGALIRDCLDRSETAMDQEHIFRTIELAIEAEAKAERIDR